MFIVIGTSLKVFGVEKLVKYFCGLDNTNGRRIFVNLEKPSKGFSDLFDFFWHGVCDEFCRSVGDELGFTEVVEDISLEIPTKNVEESLCEELSTIQISPVKNDMMKDEDTSQDDKEKNDVGSKAKEVKSKSRKKIGSHSRRYLLMILLSRIHLSRRKGGSSQRKKSSRSYFHQLQWIHLRKRLHL